MKRRTFIRNTAIAGALFPLIHALDACRPGESSKKRIFVIIQLIGGNDGLNTLIPLNDYDRFVKARPNIFIPEQNMLRLKGQSDTALHPAMAGIRELYDAQLVSFVQGVGYENQNYSHFRSADIYLTGAESTNVLYTGWMARYLQTQFPNYPESYPSKNAPHPPAIKVGDTGTFLFQGNAMDMSIVIDAAALAYEKNGAVAMDAAAATSYAEQEVRTIKELLWQSDKYAPVIANAMQVPLQHSKRYPEQGKNPLADQLKMVAKLIHGGLNTSVYHVDLKGFDTHVDQVLPGDTTKGVHADLLAKLSEAVACFWDDMVHIGMDQQVAGMSFSEFGRRIASNASHGTDHGAAQPVMLFGANIQPGIIGKNPDIPTMVDGTHNLDMQVDFKTVYQSILSQWYHLDRSAVEKILPHPENLLPLFKA